MGDGTDEEAGHGVQLRLQRDHDGAVVREVGAPGREGESCGTDHIGFEPLEGKGGVDPVDACPSASCSASVRGLRLVEFREHAEGNPPSLRLRVSVLLGLARVGVDPVYPFRYEVPVPGPDGVNCRRGCYRGAQKFDVLQPLRCAGWVEVDIVDVEVPGGAAESQHPDAAGYERLDGYGGELGRKGARDEEA